MVLVFDGLDGGPLKDHLLLNSGRYKGWPEFQSEILDYRRATQPSNIPCPRAAGRFQWRLG
eukprot:12889983-Prorocentrum_lima.AAC.1